MISRSQDSINFVKYDLMRFSIVRNHLSDDLRTSITNSMIENANLTPQFFSIPVIAND